MSYREVISADDVTGARGSLVVDALFGDISPTAEAAFEKISAELGGLSRDVLEQAAAQAVTPRTAAHAIAATR